MKTTCGMRENSLYNVTSERFWEKLEYNRDKINIDCINFKEPFPIDQLVKKYPFVSDLIKEVEEEYNYQMSEFQCSWAVVAFYRNDMDKYNIEYGINLTARP